MTSDANSKDDLERPFKTHEKIRFMALIAFVYPLGLAVLLLPGAYLRNFPNPPNLWYGFWVTEIGFPCIMLLYIPWLFEYPRIVRARMNKIVASKDESVAEQRFHKITNFIFWFGMVGTTYDASNSADSFPKVWNWIGLASIAAAMAWIIWVMRTNKYAARVVHVQPGQQLITTGPYALVRHPMYMAIIPCFCGLPLSVGSFWGLLPMCLCLIMIAFRTYDEENFLVATFGKEYEDYRKKVPYKMIPFIF